MTDCVRRLAIAKTQISKMQDSDWSNPPEDLIKHVKALIEPVEIDAMVLGIGRDICV